jgi:hypothetical protein
MAAMDRDMINHFISKEPRAANVPPAKRRESPGRKGVTTNPVSKKMMKKRIPYVQVP